MKTQPSRFRAWYIVVAVLAAVAALTLPRLLRQQPPDPWPNVTFADVTEAVGVRFSHFNAASKWKYLPETMGAGVAILDYDGDGENDILFVNGRPWPGMPGGKPTLALYRNNGDGTFRDVTRDAGLDVSMFGMGVAVGDFDNDGWPDLFLTGLGGNKLFRNVDGKRFEDVTARAGVGGPARYGWPATDRFDTHDVPLNWSASAAWLDHDGDGRLDLFVTNYVTWSPRIDADAGARLASGERAYGPPRAFAGTQCFLYRNLGGGRFENVSKLVEVSQRGQPVGKSLGVAVGDFDGDGWPDVAVANDTERNFLFHNVPGPDGKRRFEEIGMSVGVAYSDRNARGAMGIDWQPGYRQGKNALLIGNFADEPNTLLVHQRQSELRFADLAVSEGIAAVSRPLLKFGLFFLDYDLDGRPDFLTCNGHLEPDIGRADPSQKHAQPAQLFLQRGEPAARYELVPEKAVGVGLLRPMVGRGCAVGDLDGDGLPDLVLTGNGGPARVLRSVNRTGNNWVRLRLRGDGKRSNTMAIGARVVLQTNGGEQHREVQTSRGYLSCSEHVLTFGLGKAAKADKVTIHWPGRDGGVTMRTDLEAGRTHDLRQGE